MAKIAYILLCHKDPDGVIAQARRLTAAGDVMAIHFDARAPRADHDRIRTALAGNPAVVFAARRARCGWGEWSLVAATLHAVRAALAHFPEATHLYLLSGDCMAIKPAAHAHASLDAAAVDHIESRDFFGSGWIRTGIREERLIYRHFFNERRQKRLFYAAIAVQQRLGLRRRIPPDLRVRIGSQWWCLRRGTVEAILAFMARRPDVVRFFRRSWIPDETFFQTLVRHLVPEAEIRDRSPTFLMFSDYGMPVTFYNDHYDLLLGQDFLFARKISAGAHDLRARLGALYASPAAGFAISDEGRNLYGYLTGQGRVGRRFAPRFWESGATLGRERTLMIATCKKWHVAKRLVERVRQTGIPAVDYLFCEEATPLPDLGGIEATIKKRSRHRRALVRMLFDHWQTDRLVICLDPGRLDLMQDFDADRSRTRILEIECDFTDDDLAGHARRVGLAGAGASQATLGRVLPTIRHDLRFESERLRDAGFAGMCRMREAAPPDENAAALARFLDIAPAEAHRIIATDPLFAD